MAVTKFFRNFALRKKSKIMKHIKCVNCGNDVEISIAKAIDEEGEVFMCSNCGFIFSYMDK